MTSLAKLLLSPVKAVIRRIRRRIGLHDLRRLAYFGFFESQARSITRQTQPKQELLALEGCLAIAWAAPNDSGLFYFRHTMQNVQITTEITGFEFADAYAIWGHLFHASRKAACLLAAARARGSRVFLLEDGFFKNACTAADESIPVRYTAGLSFTLDDSAFYYDATQASQLERLLQSEKNLEPGHRQRAENLIDLIVENKLSKYNHQPLYLDWPDEAQKYVLVIDQTRDDFSVLRGLATERTFRDMLTCAIAENPTAIILVKVHPDTLTASARKGGYYSAEIQSERVRLLTMAINPILLLQQVERVYVCTSQLGFEALMCGCDVVTFGVPFYAGWGLTDDRSPHLDREPLQSRRGKRRSLAEIFYFAYIEYSLYVNPDTRQPCEIEEALAYLLRIRAEFHQRYLSGQTIAAQAEFQSRRP